MATSRVCLSWKRSARCDPRLATREYFLYPCHFPPPISAPAESSKPNLPSTVSVNSGVLESNPNAIIARADHEIPEEHIDKIALFCDVEKRAVIPAVTSDILYQIPLELEKNSLGSYITESLGLPNRTPDLEIWRQMIQAIKQPKPSTRIGIVGKYVELHDAYMSVREALVSFRHCQQS